MATSVFYEHEFQLGPIHVRPKGILCVNFKNSDVSSFRRYAGTTCVLTKKHSVLMLRQICPHTMYHTNHKEHYGENRILISLFVNELSVINENSKWPPSGHLLILDQHGFQLGSTRHQEDYICEVSEL